jgi:hypothetical protein
MMSIPSTAKRPEHVELADEHAAILQPGPCIDEGKKADDEESRRAADRS